MSVARIFLIHATPVSIGPIGEAFARLWPEAELVNLLEDSLSRDLASAGALTDELKQRFLTLANYALQAGADAILFTCSAFGAAIDLCKSELAIPVLKPNEAMIDLAIAQATRIAVIATFPPAIDSMVQEFRQAAHLSGRALDITAFNCPQAFEALHSGDAQLHDTLIADLVSEINDQEVICFAQFSMVSAMAQSLNKTALKVLTTPDSAVLRLRACLEGA